VSLLTLPQAGWIRSRAGRCWLGIEWGYLNRNPWWPAFRVL